MSLQARREKILLYKKKLRRKKFVAILLALFLLGVNAFAWFVFNTQVGVTVHGNVAAWDIRLRDEDNQLVEEAVVEVSLMKPGMESFSKTYIVNNLGEVDASFSYQIESLSILGNTIDLSTISDRENYCASYYPFSITFTPSTDVIPSLDSASFTIQVDWDYEDSTQYYALNSVYQYDSSFQYYTLNNNQYSNFSALPSNYLQYRDSLYLQKDDADTYFGMRCHEYESTSGNSCLVIDLTLRVAQTNS